MFIVKVSIITTVLTMIVHVGPGHLGGEAHVWSVARVVESLVMVILSHSVAGGRLGRSHGV